MSPTGIQRPRPRSGGGLAGRRAGAAAAARRLRPRLRAGGTLGGGPARRIPVGAGAAADRRPARQRGERRASAFWHAVSGPEAVAALKLTLIVSAIVVAINAVFGTLIAWVLVRDEFPGKGVVNALIDLPFALPTIVAGVVLLALYGKGGPTGIDITFTRAAVGLALLFVTLPFVVRSVQPVLLELDGSMEEAASSLGAGGWTVFRRVVLPNLTPGDPLWRGALLRTRARRVRLGRADLRQPPVQDGSRRGRTSSTRSRTTTCRPPRRCRSYCSCARLSCSAG